MVWPGGASAQPLQQVIADAQSVRDGGQRGIDRADADEEAGVHHIKIVQLVSLAMDVEHGRFRVRAETAGARLVANSGDRNGLSQVEVVGNEMRVAIDVLQQGAIAPVPRNSANSDEFSRKEWLEFFPVTLAY